MTRRHCYPAGDGHEEFASTFDPAASGSLSIFFINVCRAGYECSDALIANSLFRFRIDAARNCESEATSVSQSPVCGVQVSRYTSGDCVCSKIR